MNTQNTVLNDDYRDPLFNAEGDEDVHEEDLWFLPEPMEQEPEDLPPGPRTEPSDTAVIENWAKAEGVHAVRLARVAGRLGALDDRLLRGPEGWRHRLALIEVADLSWLAGDRVSSDRLALWISMRLSGAQDDPNAMARAGWAVRRLTGGPGVMGDLAAFLDRRDSENIEDSAERFEDRANGWLDVIAAAADLHPITQACMGFHLWSLAGLGEHGDQMEAAVTASRIAASDGNGAIFAPIAMGGARGLRVSGLPHERLARWLDGMNSAILTAMRHLDDTQAWSARAEGAMSQLSGRTPAALRSAFTEWPLVSAPMAEALVRQEAGIFLLPGKVGRLADRRLATDLSNGRAFLALFNDERLLRVRKFARLHTIPLLSQPEKRSGKLQLQTVQFPGIRSGARKQHR